MTSTSGGVPYKQYFLVPLTKALAVFSPGLSSVATVHLTDE